MIQFEILWPLEISEDNLLGILAFVEENMRISEINENVTITLDFLVLQSLQRKAR